MNWILQFYFVYSSARWSIHSRNTVMLADVGISNHKSSFIIQPIFIILIATTSPHLQPVFLCSPVFSTTNLSSSKSIQTHQSKLLIHPTQLSSPGTPLGPSISRNDQMLNHLLRILWDVFASNLWLQWSCVDQGCLSRSSSRSSMSAPENTSTTFSTFLTSACWSSTPVSLFSSTGRCTRYTSLPLILQQAKTWPQLQTHTQQLKLFWSCQWLFL